MSAKEVMGRKDINYAKGFVRGKENVDSTTEPLRKGQFTNTYLFHRFFFSEKLFQESTKCFFNQLQHLVITQGLIRCNAKIMIISSILTHFQF